MSKIWYLIKCLEGTETDYIEKCQELVETGDLQEIVCFRYQRMMRYGGSWHLERKTLLPGYIFLFGTEKVILRRQKRAGAYRGRQGRGQADAEILLYPCEISYLKMLCSDGDLIEMSRGIIKKGVLVVTEGPLKGREALIRKIDRHKRTAELCIPINGKDVEVTVGLEIYQKQQ